MLNGSRLRKRKLLAAAILSVTAGCAVNPPPEGGRLYVTGCGDDIGMQQGVRLLEWDAAGNLRPGWFVKCAEVNYLVHSADGQLAYATANDGDLVTFRCEPAGWRVLERQPTGGKVSCHLALSPEGRYLYTANYGDGSVSEFELRQGRPAFRRLFRTEDIHPAARDGAHAHFVGFTPDGKFLAVVDLGIDAVLLYPYRPERGIVPEASAVKFAPGAGPRHLVWSADGKYAYVANELNSTVSVLRYECGRFELLNSVATVPADFQGDNYPAAIRLSPDGRWLLVSNRGMDTLAVLALDGIGGMKELRCCPIAVADWPSKVKNAWPRDFDFTPDGEKIIVANERTGQIGCFAFNPATGEVKVLSAISLPGAMSVLF